MPANVKIGEGDSCLNSVSSVSTNVQFDRKGKAVCIQWVDTTRSRSTLFPSGGLPAHFKDAVDAGFNLIANGACWVPGYQGGRPATAAYRLDRLDCRVLGNWPQGQLSRGLLVRL